MLGMETRMEPDAVCDLVGVDWIESFQLGFKSKRNLGEIEEASQRKKERRKKFAVKF